MTNPELLEPVCTLCDNEPIVKMDADDILGSYSYIEGLLFSMFEGCLIA